MTSKEALEDLFSEANRVHGEEYHFNTLELYERYNLIRKDLEMLEIFKLMLGNIVNNQQQGE